MTIRKRWPTHAEDLRLDCIALTLDIDLWQVRLEEALRRGDAVEPRPQVVHVAHGLPCATLRPTSPIGSTASTRYRPASAAALANHTVDVAPPPGSRTTGGASSLPQTLTCVVPKSDSTVTGRTSAGHFASTAS